VEVRPGVWLRVGILILIHKTSLRQDICGQLTLVPPLVELDCCVIPSVQNN
jgi:hypothetical protein